MMPTELPAEIFLFALALLGLLILMVLKALQPPKTDNALAGRLADLERKVALLLQHCDLEPPQDSSLDECRRLANTGHMIEAIKLYRDKTGAGLKEAKEAIEAMTRR